MSDHQLNCPATWPGHVIVVSETGYAQKYVRECACAGLEGPATPPPRCATCRWARGVEGGRFLACAKMEIDDTETYVSEEGTLYVAPDFGCVMHEAEDAAPCAHDGTGTVEYAHPDEGRCRKCGAWIKPPEAKP